MEKSEKIYGNVFFREIESENSVNTYNACYWDLWIAKVLTEKFDNNWDALLQAIRTKDHYKRDKYWAIANHIRNLKEELDNYGFKASDIFDGLDADFLKKQAVKIKKKVLEFDFQQSELTDWMINTPQKLLYDKALYGNWQDFPINPAKCAVDLEKKFKKNGIYTKGTTHTLRNKLQEFIDKTIAKATIPQLIAIYRAFLSVTLEKINIIDDSYGVVGEMYKQVFEKYIKIDRRELKMPIEAFLTDILELIIWEDYGGIDTYETDFFILLSPEEVLITESILRKEIEMLWKYELEYKAENALTTLSILYARNKMFDKFVPLAKEMGTRHWHRITILAETAEENGKRDLAIQVYEACLVEGWHYDSLKKKYEELLNRNQ